jgi:hypothetical protein
MKRFEAVVAPTHYSGAYGTVKTVPADCRLLGTRVLGPWHVVPLTIDGGPIDVRGVMHRSLLATTLLVCLVSPGVAAAKDEPDYRRIRAALEQPVRPARFAVSKASVSVIRPARSQAVIQSGRRDSVWDGLFIGAAIGAAGGYVWARHGCGSNNPECLAIAGTVGVLGGFGIGAAIGAIVDALHN